MDELRRIRKERGLSQQRLADLANVDKVTIVHIEGGKVSPKVETLEKLAAALGVEMADLFPKAQPPLPEADLERRGGATDTELLREYEDLTRRYRMAFRRELEGLAEPWDERLRSGAFDRSMVEQFFADVAAISEGVSQALATGMDEERVRWMYKGLPRSEEDTKEMWASAIAPAGASLLALCDELLAAAAEKFSQSELEALRHKRDEARRALGSAA
jgi:transcriptional regulator with XRE-family HTH domain